MRKKATTKRRAALGHSVEAYGLYVQASLRSTLLLLLLLPTVAATNLCADNEHVSNGACEPCPPGHTRDGGDDPGGGQDTACTVCAEDHSVERRADGSGWECVQCCDGYTRRAGDDLAALNHTTTCDQCAAYYHAAAEDDTAEEEEEEEGAAAGFSVFASGLRCAPCADGTWRQAGDNVDDLEAPTECFAEVGIYPSIVLGALFLVLLAACALLRKGRSPRVDDDDAEGPSGPRSGTTGPLRRRATTRTTAAAAARATAATRG